MGDQIPTLWPESVGPRSVGPRSVGPRSMGPRSVCPHCMGSQAVGPQSVGSQSVGTHTIGSESILHVPNHVFMVSKSMVSISIECKSCGSQPNPAGPWFPKIKGSKTIDSESVASNSIGSSSSPNPSGHPNQLALGPLAARSCSWLFKHTR